MTGALAEPRPADLRKASTMASLTVATTQFALRPETSVEGYLTHTEDLVRQAVAQGAEVVVFPELASTGLLAAIADHQVTTQTITSDYWQALPVHLQPLVEGIADSQPTKKAQVARRKISRTRT